MNARRTKRKTRSSSAIALQERATTFFGSLAHDISTDAGYSPSKTIALNSTSPITSRSVWK